MMLELWLNQAESPRPVAEIMADTPEQVWRDVASEQLLVVETPQGSVTVMLSSSLALNHVAQAKTLAREGFYEGLSFYRVVPGFVAQGGDHTDQKDKGSASSALQAEFEEPLPKDARFDPFPYGDGYAADVGHVDGIPTGRDAEAGTVWHLHCTGAFAYARNAPKDTASTEIYFTLQPQRYLDRNLTVAGRVIEGMDVLQAAPRGVVDDDPETDDFSERLRINRMTLASDMDEDVRPKFQIMDTSSDTFRELTAANAARPSNFFYVRPNYVDICKMPVPTRRTPDTE